MSIDLQELPAFPQSQESLSRQIAILIAVANRLGLYDAADAVYRLTPRLDEVKCGCHVVYAQGGELILAYHKRVGEVPHPVGLAAALEALADQVVPPLHRLGLMHPAARDETQAIRNDVLAIAAQLRGSNQTTPPDNRNPDCVAAWPDCHDGGYDPRCCRFPKSCSCKVRSAPQPQPPAL